MLMDSSTEHDQFGRRDGNERSKDLQMAAGQPSGACPLQCPITQRHEYLSPSPISAECRF
eukprot:scaffold37824_cov161-Skeletonema_dohrnii-CCMP3373.AAC.2